MDLYHILWKEQFLDKITGRHGVTSEEVEEILFTKPHVRRAEKGRVKNEHLYAAYGQTTTGRYVIVFFIHKHSNTALPISAREMTLAERRYYHAQKKTR